MKKYQAESAMMGDIATLHEDDPFSVATTFTASHKRFSSTNTSKAGTVTITPRDSLRYSLVSSTISLQFGCYFLYHGN